MLAYWRGLSEWGRNLARPTCPHTGVSARVDMHGEVRACALYLCGPRLTVSLRELPKQVNLVWAGPGKRSGRQKAAALAAPVTRTKEPGLHGGLAKADPCRPPSKASPFCGLKVKIRDAFYHPAEGQGLLQGAQ